MKNRNHRFVRTMNIITDSLILFFTYFVAVYLKYTLMENETVYQGDGRFWLIMVIYCLMVPVCYYVLRRRVNTYFRRGSEEYICIMAVNSIGTLSLGTVFYVLRITEFSREAFFMYSAISCFLVLIKHFLGHLFFLKFRSYGYYIENVIVAGSGKHADEFIRQISRKDEPEYHFLGVVCRTGQEKQTNYLGTYDELEKIIEEYSPDALVVALELDEAQFLEKILATAGKEGIKIFLIPFCNEYIPSRPDVMSVGKSRMIDLRTTPLDGIIGATCKRLGDILISAVSLVILSPLFFVLAFGTKLSDPGPVFFRQERIGKDKKVFTMYKFRSMRLNAVSDTAWSKDSDERKTKFGSFMRKFSLDELPQLFNVLKGDMSLVGPRPEIPFFVRKFKESVPLYLVRQQIRPGMTGLAQINGLRGDTSIEARVKYDIWYIENWSLWLDIKILLITVFKGKFINNEVLER